MDKNNSSNGNVPAPVAGFEPEAPRFSVARCLAMRYGQQCLRQPGHKGRHMAPGGAMVFWEQSAEGDREQQLEVGLSALLWVSWARELGVDASEMQVRLLSVCGRAGIHPSTLLINLF